MNKYEILEVIGEGTYGIVLKASNKVFSLTLTQISKPDYMKAEIMKGNGSLRGDQEIQKQCKAVHKPRA
jgi:serine/threonine protein kinase